MTAKQHFSTVLNDMEGIVFQHPYHAFVLLAIMIEVLGKCLSSALWQQKGQSHKDFNRAINKYASLKKYDTVPNMYYSLRCGLAHVLLIKNGIILAPERNDLSQNIIGCKDLYRDLCQAWNDIITGVIKTAKNLDEEILPIHDGVSGTTKTIVYS